MVHVIDVELATKIGLTEAILLKNLEYWIEKNRVNDKHFHDGHYWTYNSVRAFNLLFPYLTPKKIYNALSKLEDMGLIITNNYNVSKYDRTKWFSITETGYNKIKGIEDTLPVETNDSPNEKISSPSSKIDFPKGKIEFLEKENQNTQKGEPIPNSNQIETNSKPYTPAEPLKIPPTEKVSIEKEVVSIFNSTCTNLPKVAKLTDARKKAIRKILKIMTVNEWTQACININQSPHHIGQNNRGWKADFDWLISNDKAIKFLEKAQENTNQPQNAESWTYTDEMNLTLKKAGLA